MVSGVQSSKGPESLQPEESSKQRQEFFELQWEIYLIGTYLSVSSKNGNLQHQLKNIQKEVASGKSPAQLVPSMNQLIDSINAGLSQTESAFPGFELTTSGNEAGAMANHVISLQKFLNVAAHENLLPWDTQQVLFDEARTLVDQIGVIPNRGAIEKLNEIIQSANQFLPPTYHLKPLGGK